MKTVLKKRYIWLLSSLTTVLLGGALLAGCTGGGTSLEDVVEGGYNCVVTFDTAGGQWSSGATGGSSSSGEDGEEEDTAVRMEERKYYVKSGSLLNENSAIKFAETVRTGYTFNTYWTGTKDTSGRVTYGKPWNFATDRVTEDITLYARWMENYSLVAHYGEGFSMSKTFTVPQNSQGVAQPMTSLSFISENITVIQMYRNADKSEPFEVSVQTPLNTNCTAENKVDHIYVDSIEGSWTLVRTKSDFVIYQNSWLYLLADIDFEGEEITIPSTFTGKINSDGGNGGKRTVKNFTVKQEMGNRNERYYGLFREIRSAGDGTPAEIQNVTFENVKFTAELTNPQVIEYNAGVFAGRVTEETVIENVTVTGTFDFAVTTKGNTATPNHYDVTEVTSAIGYELDGVDMSKFHVDITGATVTKHADELPKEPAEEDGADQNNE